MTKKTWAWTFVGIWDVLFILSFIVPPRFEPTGDGFVQGLNRIAIFFQFQLAAGIVGFLAWRFGRAFDQPSWQRWISRGPLLVALAGLSLMVALLVWSNLGGRTLPMETDTPATTTAPADADNS